MWETWVWSLGLGRSPGEGKGYPLQYSGLKNSMDIVHGVTKSDTTECFSLSLFTLLSKAGFDSVIYGEWKSNLKVFESKTTSPLNILTGNLFVTLLFVLPLGLPLTSHHLGQRLHLALSPPIPCHIQISLMALDLLPRQGVGMCQREQSKSEGLDLLTLGPPISQKEIQKSLCWFLCLEWPLSWLQFWTCWSTL